MKNDSEEVAGRYYRKNLGRGIIFMLPRCCFRFVAFLIVAGLLHLTPARADENRATPIERIKAAKDFRVELLYSVPAPQQGSWVNLCTDDRGRILVSDQYGGLYRFAPPPMGKPLDANTIERVPAKI